MRRLILVFAVIGVAVLLASGTALGITGGWADDGVCQTEEPEEPEPCEDIKYPNVGALVDPDGLGDGSYTYCTGTLISPTVFLTAAHCAPRTGEAVTFETHYDPASSKVYTICRGPACIDANQDGYPDNFDGRFRADPNGYDIAAVKFNEPIEGITPAQLPSRLYQFDRVAKGQKFTAVGYGEQGVTSPVYDTRHYAVSTFKSVSEDYLRLSQNLNQDNGGTCYGDSGGPNFVGQYGINYDTDPATPLPASTIASITNTGDPWCKATNVTLRLDNAAARKFLSSQFFEGQDVTPPS